jgi:hypothetical protein
MLGRRRNPEEVNNPGEDPGERRKPGTRQEPPTQMHRTTWNRGARTPEWSPTTRLEVQHSGTRLLHPPHLDGTSSGLTLYRLPFDILSEYPEPWLQHTRGCRSQSSPIISPLKKNPESQASGGGKCFEKKTDSSLFVRTLFFSQHFPPCLGELKCSDYSRTYFLMYAGGPRTMSHT